MLSESESLANMFFTYLTSSLFYSSVSSSPSLAFFISGSSSFLYAKLITFYWYSWSPFRFRYCWCVVPLFDSISVLIMFDGFTLGCRSKDSTKFLESLCDVDLDWFLDWLMASFLLATRSAEFLWRSLFGVLFFDIGSWYSERRTLLSAPFDILVPFCYSCFLNTLETDWRVPSFR